MRPETRELRTVLERALSRPDNSASLEVRELRRRPSPYASSHPLEVLVVAFGDGTTAELLLKELSPARLLESAKGVKPERLVDPRRELQVYEEVLEGRRLGTPALYGTFADEATGRFWLLVEHVKGSPLWQIGAFEVWEAAATWLARMHETTRSAVAAAPRSLIRYDAAELRLWPRLAVLAADPANRKMLRHIEDRYDAVLELLEAEPASFVHGEFYASNILVGESGARISPADWEMAGTGAAVLDLAALGAGWDELSRSTLARAYLQACTAPIRQERFTQALEAARLHNALRWLGWSTTWTPPPEHRTDWLQEAKDAAERLGL